MSPSCLLDGSEQNASKELGSGSNDYRFDTVTKFFGEWSPSVAHWLLQIVTQFGRLLARRDCLTQPRSARTRLQSSSFRGVAVFAQNAGCATPGRGCMKYRDFRAAAFAQNAGIAGPL